LRLFWDSFSNALRAVTNIEHPDGRLLNDSNPRRTRDWPAPLLQILKQLGLTWNNFKSFAKNDRAVDLLNLHKMVVQRETTGADVLIVGAAPPVSPAALHLAN